MRDLSGSTIMIDNDMWSDAGRRYKVQHMTFKPNSTGVLVEMIDEEGQVHKRVIPYYQIYTVE